MLVESSARAIRTRAASFGERGERKGVEVVTGEERIGVERVRKWMSLPSLKE